ncbi:protein cereblon-like isoform X2 [Galleria mellonella]|uniref:Protein cereblon-like isoform X2 n=1 Tax=Galleria mellonella TaxID=7137 RepID=A0ABM3MQT6_GALME|nr:protein cereblon-like isoform X2 [Galleria mellonella]
MFNIFLRLLLYSYAFVNIYTFAEEYSKTENNGQEVLLCRKCGADVADSYYLFSKLSPGSRKIEKQNLFGKQNVTIQTLVNPFGVKFEIITTEKARCDNIGPRQGADSWFPGYAWRICACPHCGQHLGWTFDSSKSPDTSTEKSQNIQTFHGLILSNVLGENYSLIMMPKMYKM